MEIQMHERSAGSIVGASARVLGNVIRLPLVVVLLLLAPAINVVCGVVIAGGAFAAGAFELSLVGPRFPLVAVLTLCLSAIAVLVLYHSVLALLVRD